MRFDSIPNLLSFKHSYIHRAPHLSHYVSWRFYLNSLMLKRYLQKSTVYFLTTLYYDDRNIDSPLVCQDRLARSIALHSPKVENSSLVEVSADT